MGEYADDALDQAIDNMLRDEGDVEREYISPIRRRNLMAGRPPDLNVCIRGEEYAKKKFRYHQIGHGWTEDNGASLIIEFAAPIILQPGMKLRLFEKTEKESDRVEEENF